MVESHGEIAYESDDDILVKIGLSGLENYPNKEI